MMECLVMPASTSGNEPTIAPANANPFPGYLPACPVNA